ncbi:MAG TPA: glycosyltransferase [Acidimicrobiia bacterium]|jgi:hypothetical protein
MSRQLEFRPTEAVQSARRRDRFIPCPACASTQQRYLFHRTGARFVQCRACDLVYADPVDTSARGYFDIAALGTHDAVVDRENMVHDFRLLLDGLAASYQAHVGRRLRSVLVLGRWHHDFARTDPEVDVSLGAEIVGDEETLLTKPLVESFGSDLGQFDLILLNEFIEATPDPSLVLDGLADALGTNAVVAVAFSNTASLPSRVLRRRWKSFFDHKVGYYNADNLEVLMWRCGFRRLSRERVFTTYSPGYLATRLQAPPTIRSALTGSWVSHSSVRLASGHEVIAFVPESAAAHTDKLSIIVPVYNEERYVGEVIRALIDKELPIEKEIVVVESNSRDRSREIVRTFEGEPAVRVLLEEKPRGKGHAVRAALAEITGTIVLIQDADFEYDLDDYEALLEPIVQHHASFVLGSRSLGLDDWKVRRYATSRVKGLLMNLAQIAFAKTFNVLYRQKVTDINTMLKVFRRECIDGCNFRGDGFNFDIELVCKIVRNGFSPFEVPVNYVARGFDEGKKINFLLDAYPSYYQLWKCRVGPI